MPQHALKTQRVSVYVPDVVVLETVTLTASVAVNHQPPRPVEGFAVTIPALPWWLNPLLAAFFSTAGGFILTTLVNLFKGVFI
jgi:hypothetical protein